MTPRTLMTAAAGVTAAAVSTALISAPAQAAVATSPSSVYLGRPYRMLGPSGNIDSLYVTVKTARHTYAFMSNGTTVEYDQAPSGRIANPRVILRNGPTGSINQCGTHLEGSVIKTGHGRWYGFIHVEKADPARLGGRCHIDGLGRNPTRWSLVRAYSWDAGRTWHLGKQVLRQDAALMTNPDGSWAVTTDDLGSPRVIITGDWLYMFYRAATVSGGPQQMSVARAPRASLGKPGSWHKWYAGAFSQPGLGGHQSPISGLPSTARGISWNNYLHRFIDVQVWNSGIRLYEAAPGDITHWAMIGQLAPPITPPGVSAWRMTCVHNSSYPAAQSYGATVGLHGTVSTGQQFWIYYMFKPVGQCFNQRVLLRREVWLK